MFAVTVRFRIIPGHWQSFLEAVNEQARVSLRKEPGCIQFDVCRTDDTSHEIFLFEKYTSPAAFFADHLGSEHFRSFDATVSGWVTEKSVATHRVLNHG